MNAYTPIVAAPLTRDQALMADFHRFEAEYRRRSAEVYAAPQRKRGPLAEQLRRDMANLNLLAPTTRDPKGGVWA